MAMLVGQSQRHSLETLAAWYLGLQAAGTCAWWIGIGMSDAFRAWFIPKGIDSSFLGAFLTADMLILSLVGGSAAWGLWFRRSWAWAALCVHAGGAVYASVLAIGLALLAMDSAPGGLLMAPTLVTPLYFVWALRPEAMRR